ncbi:hypothetical protein VTK73DRAFT_5160 [Phialemonium thermophilum]|uniref:Uncharacterized protein n=1 Tax=Phialemonium thermophilum TaxID=223376 RepID=A0ABR3XYM6_9PEZI
MILSGHKSATYLATHKIHFNCKVQMKHIIFMRVQDRQHNHVILRTRASTKRLDNARTPNANAANQQSWIDPTPSYPSSPSSLRARKYPKDIARSAQHLGPKVLVGPDEETPPLGSTIRDSPKLKSTFDF